MPRGRILPPSGGAYRPDGVVDCPDGEIGFTADELREIHAIAREALEGCASSIGPYAFEIAVARFADELWSWAKRFRSDPYYTAQIPGRGLRDEARRLAERRELRRPAACDRRATHDDLLKRLKGFEKQILDGKRVPFEVRAGAAPKALGRLNDYVEADIASALMGWRDEPGDDDLARVRRVYDLLSDYLATVKRPAAVRVDAFPKGFAFEIGWVLKEHGVKVAGTCPETAKHRGAHFYRCLAVCFGGWMRDLYDRKDISTHVENVARDVNKRWANEAESNRLPATSVPQLDCP